MDKVSALAVMRFVAVSLLAAKTALFLVALRQCVRRDLQFTFDGMAVRQKGRVLLGLFMCSFGLTVHQLYWWLAEMAKAHGSSKMLNTLFEFAWLTAFPYLVLFAGVVLVFSPWLESVAGERWPVLAAAILGALLLMGGINAV